MHEEINKPRSGARQRLSLPPLPPPPRVARELKPALITVAGTLIAALVGATASFGVEVFKQSKAEQTTSTAEPECTDEANGPPAKPSRVNHAPKKSKSPRLNVEAPLASRNRATIATSPSACSRGRCFAASAAEVCQTH